MEEINKIETEKQDYEQIKFYVYLHKNLVNQKCYCGITCQEPKNRWAGGSGYKGQPFFYRAIKKYGWENFEHRIVYEVIGKTKACECERELIKVLRSNQKEFGYNLTPGGDWGTFSGDAPKIHIPTEEEKKRLSERMKGNRITFARGNTAVVKISLDGRIVDWYPSADAAQVDGNGSAGAIRYCAEHVLNYNTHGGYKWEFAFNVPSEQWYDLAVEKMKYFSKLYSMNEDNLVKLIKTEYTEEDKKGVHIYSEEEKELLRQKKKKKPRVYKPMSDYAKIMSSMKVGEPVLKISKDGQILDWYQSVKYAANLNDSDPTEIKRRALHKKIRKVKEQNTNITWEYAKNYPTSQWYDLAVTRMKSLAQEYDLDEAELISLIKTGGDEANG